MRDRARAFCCGSPEGSPGLREDIASPYALLRRPSGIGNVASQVTSIMDDANALLLEVRAEGGRRGPPVGLIRIHSEVQDLGKLLHQDEPSAQMSRLRSGEFPVISIDMRHDRGQSPGKVMKQGQVDDCHRKARKAASLRNTSAGQGGSPNDVVKKEEPAIGCHSPTPRPEDAKGDPQLPASLKNGGTGQGIERLGDVHHHSPNRVTKGVGKVNGGLQVVGDVLHSSARDAREANWSEGAEPAEGLTRADTRPSAIDLAEHLDRASLGSEKGGLGFGEGGDGRADSLKRPQSGALDVIVEGAQRGEDRVREGQHVIARDAIKPSGGVFVQAAKMSSQTGRGDGRKGLRRRRGEVGQALEEHIPPWFIKLGCSTPVRGPEGSKPFNGGIRMGIGDGLSDSQPSEVMSEAVKPSLVIRHRHDREAVGLPGNGVRGEQGFSTMGGDATSTKVAIN